MRNPDRIPEILDLLGQIWLKHPDLRLGQILVNATGITTDMFFVEDDDVIEALKRFRDEY